ncbi:histidine phosphatase family protein [Bacillus sp. H-16]|uniref:histidine phosphatase family protein n=1 Tax=Alteribacter salitolerans TaxID=2912333 RepID=UPI001964C7BF|nr:histidine phosphatase family protein [Alteribacter salitolerans]MBM7097423.1 histidine phosphatase family protein [Alteribacter salitolerans]
MLSLYFTRHGETMWNREGRLQGWHDSPLTKEGENIAKSLGHYFRDIPLSTIYTSTSGRTIRTAELINSGQKTPIVLDERLREIHLGEWEGKTREEIASGYSKERLEAFWNNPEAYKPAGGETFCQVESRVNDFISDIYRNHQNGHVLLVTHTVIVKLLLKRFKNRMLHQLWDPPFIHPGCLNLVEIDRNRQMNVLLEGDLSHEKYYGS